MKELEPKVTSSNFLRVIKLNLGYHYLPGHFQLFIAVVDFVKFIESEM